MLDTQKQAYMINDCLPSTVKKKFRRKQYTHRRRMTIRSEAPCGGWGAGLKMQIIYMIQFPFDLFMVLYYVSWYSYRERENTCFYPPLFAERSHHLSQQREVSSPLTSHGAISPYYRMYITMTWPYGTRAPSFLIKRSPPTPQTVYTPGRYILRQKRKKTSFVLCPYCCWQQ